MNLKGGYNTIQLTSTDKIEKKIQKIRSKLEWIIAEKITGGQGNRNLNTSIETGPHTVYTTMGTPRDTGVNKHKVTIKRMERAVIDAGKVKSLDPHTLVETIIKNQGAYTIKRRANAWDVPDYGGDCGSIIRYTEKVVKMIGIPGTFEGKHVYAIETNPEQALTSPGGLANANRSYPGHDDWKLFLIDYSNLLNYFEAVAKFTYGGIIRYYTGGVPGYKDNINKVLCIFKSLSWVHNGTIEETVYTYDGSQFCTEE